MPLSEININVSSTPTINENQIYPGNSFVYTYNPYNETGDNIIGRDVVKSLGNYNLDSVIRIEAEIRIHASAELEAKIGIFDSLYSGTPHSFEASSLSNDVYVATYGENSSQTLTIDTNSITGNYFIQFGNRGLSGFTVDKVTLFEKNSGEVNEFEIYPIEHNNGVDYEISEIYEHNNGVDYLIYKNQTFLIEKGVISPLLGSFTITQHNAGEGGSAGTTGEVYTIHPYNTGSNMQLYSTNSIDWSSYSKLVIQWKLGSFWNVLNSWYTIAVCGPGYATWMQLDWSNWGTPPAPGGNLQAVKSNNFNLSTSTLFTDEINISNITASGILSIQNTGPAGEGRHNSNPLQIYNIWLE